MRMPDSLGQVKLLVKCEDVEDGPHPQCGHGPTVLFYPKDKGTAAGHFACAAYRDKRLCSFKQPASQANQKRSQTKYDYSIARLRKERQKLLDNTTDQAKHYCLTCNSPLETLELQFHGNHNVKQNLTPECIRTPSRFLAPLDNDKAQAQYFFDEKSLSFFESCFKHMQIKKIVCIGAPRLHEHLLTHCPDTISTFLLDFDHRFFHFYSDQHYAWYNMCNNYFFDEAQKDSFMGFLQRQSVDERILFFTDPPFACRTELIGNTLQQLTQLYNNINKLPHQPVAIFWIFPYFSEHYVQQQLPAMEMCDYKVNYTNHLSYTDVGNRSRKLGSPVRVFTNVPLEQLKLPVNEQYKYCAKCNKYTALENRHCSKCRRCPSKNGSTYKHCDQCDMCVKPNYTHCNNCRRCTQVEGHNCEEYQSKQTCWICRSVGHTEPHCKFWKSKSLSGLFVGSCKENVVLCFLCNSKGHNELHCSKRTLYLKESTFMGETTVHA